MKNNCGSCKYHKRDMTNDKSVEFDCVNEDSEYYGCETEYNDTCEDYEAWGD